ncbi:hypothetical protein BV898_01010 [Hypsibius exemplaris]|uniref:Uncharacterized protein n=1 Tax=Hypsibius exemplaris TaxID=2072580 RepID=A0A1W0XCX0_HYPEX|nr:hypothetical protein BV898_01010 [Hypsibius exemplaris]
MCNVTLSLVVLAHEKPLRSAIVYLMTIAVADIVVLWDNVRLYITDGKPDSLLSDPTFTKGYNEHHGMDEWGFRTFVNLSDW